MLGNISNRKSDVLDLHLWTQKLMPDSFIPLQTGLSVGVVMKRAFKLLSGFGMSVTGVHNLCGDYIYSGHSFMLIMSYMFIKECKYLKRIP